MKIGILSDTHSKKGRSAKVIEHLMGQGAEFLIHAGDIVRVEVLDQLEQSGLPYLAVYGNNDARLVEYHARYHLVQEPHYFSLQGIRFKLMHLPFYLTPDAEVVIFGHTHVFECEIKNKTLYINPGETCARDEPLSTCVLLEVLAERFEVTYFERRIGQEIFEARHYLFERG